MKSTTKKRLIAGGAVGISLALWVFLRARRAEEEFPPEGEFVMVEGVRIHFVRRGKGRPLILLHGSEGTLSDFTETIFDLLANDYEVIALDRPGHGFSETPRLSNTPELQAHLILLVLERLGIRSPILVGHSWSSLLALVYALETPDRIGGLVLLSPYVYPPSTSPSPLLKLPSFPVCGAWISAILLLPLKRKLIEHHLRLGFLPASVPSDYSRRAVSLWQRYPAQIKAFAEESRMERSTMRQYSAHYPKIKLPVLIVTGDEDRAVNASENAIRLARELPDAQLEIFKGVGHAVLHGSAERICAAIHQKFAPTAHDSNSPTLDSRARELVFRFGWNPVSYQILNPEIEHWFSEDGEAVVGFVRRNGVRVVAGAPICRADRLEEVALAFEKEAKESGDSVCYFGATDRLRTALRASARHSSLSVGSQPVWKPSQWSTIPAKHRSLRAQLNRAKNKGVRVAEWKEEAEISIGQLQICLQEWLEMHSFPPLHFLTEPVSLDRLQDRRLFAAANGEKVVGFLVGTPIPDRKGWLIEQIVRGKEAPNGTAELLVDAAMQTFAREGSEIVTLGLAPLSRRANAADPSRPWLRWTLRWVRAHGRRFYNFDGLDAFKAKFKPDFWEPVYALSNEKRFSFRTLYALAAAFSDGSPIAAMTHALASALQQEIAWKLGLKEPPQK